MSSNHTWGLLRWRNCWALFTFLVLDQGFSLVLASSKPAGRFKPDRAAGPRNHLKGHRNDACTGNFHFLACFGTCVSRY